MATAKTPNTGTKSAKNAGMGAKAGMPVGPHKPSQGGRRPNIAIPVVRTDPITGVGKTNPKAQPMYTGKASKEGQSIARIKKTSAAVSGTEKTDGKGFNDTGNQRKVQS